MRVKEGLTKLMAVMGKASDKVMKAIMNANLGALIRFGIIAGVAITTVILIFKFLHDKKKMWKDEKKKTVVDKALELNYSDESNQDKLHPLMCKVEKNLVKELKPRNRKAHRVIRKYAKQAQQRAEVERDRELESRFNDFLENYEDEEYDDRDIPTDSLRRIFSFN